MSSYLGYCGEIGDGNCPEFPTSYDTVVNQETTLSHWTYQKANDVKNICIGLENYIGIGILGGYASLSNRLTAFRISTTTMQGQIDELKISTGNVYNNVYSWDNITKNITKQTNTYVVYGSSYLNPGTYSVQINGVNQILAVLGSSDNYNVFRLLNLWQSSFTYVTTNGGGGGWASTYWQAICK
jgi:hypothetical protein